MKTKLSVHTSVLFLVLSLFLLSPLAAQQTFLQVFEWDDTTKADFEEGWAKWDRFQRENPDIKLEIAFAVDNFFDFRIGQFIASGSYPDVFQVRPYVQDGQMHKLVNQKALRDLSPLLGKDFLANFNKPALDPKMHEAGYLAFVPKTVAYTNVLYVNTKVLRDNGLKIPKTYGDIKAMVPVLRAKGIRVIDLANKEQWVVGATLFSTILGRFGGNDYLSALKAGTASFSDPPGLQAFEFLQTMYVDGVLDQSTFEIGYTAALVNFVKGESAFLVDGDWRMGEFLSSANLKIPPAEQKDNFEMIIFPAIPGEKYPGLVSAALAGGYGISSSVPAGSDREKAAVRLLKFLYSKEIEDYSLQKGLYIPIRFDAVNPKGEPMIQKRLAFKNNIQLSAWVFDAFFDGSYASLITQLNVGLAEMGQGKITAKTLALRMQTVLDSCRTGKE